MSSKVTVKRNLIIFHKPGLWADIYGMILRDYGNGMMVRTRLQRELGFTYRRHQAWFKVPHSDGRTYKYCEDQVHLDFYSESAQSWFELKYLNR